MSLCRPCLYLTLCVSVGCVLYLTVCVCVGCVLYLTVCVCVGCLYVTVCVCVQPVPKPAPAPPTKKRKRVQEEPPECLAPKPLLSGAVPLEAFLAALHKVSGSTDNQSQRSQICPVTAAANEVLSILAVFVFDLNAQRGREEVCVRVQTTLCHF